MKTDTAAGGKGSQETSQEQKSSNNTTEDQPDVSKNAPVQKKRKRCWTCNAKLELAQRELGNCRCSKYCVYVELPFMDKLFFGFPLSSLYRNCVVFPLWVDIMSSLFKHQRFFVSLPPWKYMNIYI